MKKIKNFTAYILLVIMLIAVIPSNAGAAGDSYDKILSSVGISVDYQDDYVLKRYELLKLAIANTGVDMLDGDSAVFTDVPVKSKYYTLTYTGYINGFMKGYPDGSFRPESNASVNDATGFMLAILGYGEILKNNSYVSAEDLLDRTDIMKGVSGGDLTGGKLKRMFVNLLNSNVLNIDHSGGNGFTYDNKEEKYLAKLTNGDFIEGTVTAVGAASIPNYSETKYGYIIVGGGQYKCALDNAISYLGKRIKATVEKDGDSILFMYTQQDFTQITVDAENVTSYSDYTLKYTEADGSKNKQIKLSVNSRFIVNGKNAVYDDRYFNLEYGKIKFIDSNSDGKYDLIMIDTALVYKVFELSEQDVLYDKITKESINLDGIDIEYKSNGAAAARGDVTQDSFVRVMPDALKFKADNTVDIDYSKLEKVCIDVMKTETVTGEVNSESEDELTVDGKIYKKTKYLKNTVKNGYIDEASAGNIISAVVEDSNIIYYEITSRAAENKMGKIGYLINLYPDESGDRMYIRVLEDNKEIKNIKCSDKLRVNKRKTSYADLKNDSANEGNKAIFYQGELRKQLIQYTSDANGAITDIYTADDKVSQNIYNAQNKKTDSQNPDYDTSYQGYDMTKFTLDFVSDSEIYRNGFGHLYKPDESTKIIIIPTNADKFDKYEYTDSNYLEYDSTYENIKFYNVTSDYKPEYIVIDYSGGDDSSRKSLPTPYAVGNETYIITGTVNVYDEEAQEEKQVYEAAYIEGKSKELRKVTLNCDNLDLAQSDNNWKYTDNVRWRELKKGDLLNLRYDTDGNVERFRVLARGSEGINKKYGKYGAYSGGTLAIHIGKVADRLGDNLIISFDESGEKKLGKIISGNIPQAIMVYENGRVEQGNADSISLYDTVVTRSWNGIVTEIIVYK